MKKLLAAFLTVTLAVSAPMAAMAGSAALVLDARTGKVLSSENGDTLNHPASLTKMMTLYLTFEALHRGKIGWDTKVRFSKNASSKPPTKLWVKPGQSITVREAVLGSEVVIRRSAHRRRGREADAPPLQAAVDGPLQDAGPFGTQPLGQSGVALRDRYRDIARNHVEPPPDRLIHCPQCRLVIAGDQ